MRKITLALFAIIILLTFSSCVDKDDGESITEALKISTWLMDKNLEGTGYWSYDENISAHGRWVSNESDEQIHHDDVFKFEPLQLNEVRTMAPMGYIGMPNINLVFEFDGIIELETEIPNDERVQFAYNNDYSSKPIIDTINYGTITFGKVSMLAPTNINICPLGEYAIQNFIISSDTLANQEYNFNVNAYKLDGTLYITAKLKLTVLEDKEYTSENYSIFGTADQERSRFFSIELVSYEYNDIYKFD